MNMNSQTLRTFTVVALACGSLAALSGCADTGARVIADRDKITTLGIDQQDFAAASVELTNRMLGDPGFNEEIATLAKRLPPGSKPMLKIDQVVNDTTQKIDVRSWLVEPMVATITKSRKVTFYADNPNVADIQMGEQRLPNLILSGTISEIRARAGDTKQASYQFLLRLDNDKGETIWNDKSEPLTKQGKRSAVGM